MSLLIPKPMVSLLCAVANMDKGLLSAMSFTLTPCPSPTGREVWGEGKRGYIPVSIIFATEQVYCKNAKS